MSFYPLGPGGDSDACFVVCSIFLLPPHALVVIVYNPAFLNLSCKVFSDQVLLLVVMGRIISVSFLLLACPTETDRSAGLGNVLLHFCRSKVLRVCLQLWQDREFCSWKLLWEQWLSSPATERRALLDGAAFSNLTPERHPPSINFFFCVVFWRETFWVCIMRRLSFSEMGSSS